MPRSLSSFGSHVIAKNPRASVIFVTSIVQAPGIARRRVNHYSRKMLSCVTPFKALRVSTSNLKLRTIAG